MKRRDVNEIAFDTLRQAIGEIPKKRGNSKDAAALGRLGGLRGGRARAKALTAKQRKAIASKAAKARWKS